MDNSQKPVARREGLVIQEMPEEVLVYDLATDKAHCLNQTAAFVWKSCDGAHTVQDIARLFGDEAGKTVHEDLSGWRLIN
ncbi:MAG: PqqD family protein [Acidobacteriota bacterium]|nr:PqqD family protein [Acidobacteriota bacterium]